ncbi:MAG: caspase family protein [Chitinivibrionales bacterium]|nr:caspase family protein [Chitinivibrionales bacterium]
MSPDARLAAVGGWTGWSISGNCSVYLFNTSSGSLEERLGGLPYAVADLAFSPDGVYLAISFYGGFGVRIYRAAGLELEKTLRGFGASCTHVTFDCKGRLAVSSADGRVRVYTDGFNRYRETTADSGLAPFSISFSADGAKLAVGYERSSAITIYNSPALTKTNSIPNAADEPGSFSLVAWSQTSNDLYSIVTGARSRENGLSVLRRYGDRGRAAPEERSFASGVLMDIKILPDNSIVFAGLKPQLGRIDLVSGLAYLNESDLLDLSLLDSDNFWLSPNGKEVTCSLSGSVPFVFSIADRTLRPISDDSLMHQKIKDPALGYDEKNSSKIVINGHALNLFNKSEYCSGIVFDKTSGRVMVGSNWNLFQIDASAELVWKKAMPGAVTAIALAPEANLCATALGDGTVRWYRLLDGQELLALAIAADQKRWALWTPSGFWDASERGGELLYRRVNRGLSEAAHALPVSRAGQDGYNPRAIAHLFDSYDNALANKPSVQILQPPDNSVAHDSIIVLRLKINTPRNAPLTAIVLAVNGVRQNTDLRGLAIAARQKTILKDYPVKLEPGANNLSALAYNSFGGSDTARVIVHRRTSPPGPQFCGPGENLYVIAVGISHYAKNVQPLAFPAKDAEDFTKIWSLQTPCPYQRVIPTLLTNEQATKTAIIKSLARACALATARDVIMLYMAGHGIDDAQGRFYFLPAEALSGKDYTHLISDKELLGPLEKSPAQALCFFDACDAGNIKFDIVRQSPYRRATTPGRIIILHSSAAFQPARENGVWNNGVFTMALTEGLRGNADYSATGVITVTMLSLYVSERVKELTKGLQTPVITFPGAFRDFPLAQVR